MAVPRIVASTKPAVAPLAEALGGSETILLVEDSDPLRKLTQSFLESHGFRVHAAQNGEEALQVEAQHSGKIDLLLTDVVMPGMNGKALAERLLQKQSGMRVLYISGYTDSFIARHGALEPSTVLLHKPFTEEELIRKVREVLDIKRAEGGEQRTSDLASQKH